MAGMDMKGISMPAPKPTRKAAAAPTHKPVGTRRLRPTPAAPHQSGSRAAAGSSMPGMDMSGSSAMPGTPMPDAGSSPAHDMATMPDMQHQAGAPMPGMEMNGQPVGTDLAPGNAPAPAPPMDHYADRTYDRTAMDYARAVMMRDDGGGIYHKVLLNLAEFQAHAGRNGYRWDGEAWIGGDRNRLFLKSEGEGT
ncbi:MAG: copper resistance protein B, partial [Sphingomonas sp.]|nr:copper resistance protein B [Sphingomonas sp.]